MKVLLINNFFYRKGGSESVFFNTGRLLESKGHQVIWYAFADEKNQKCGQADYFPERSKGRFRQMTEYFYNRTAARNLDRLLKAEKPDIAHIHLIWGGMTPSVLRVLRKNGVPVVHTVHDYRMVCPAYTFRNAKCEICEKCRSFRYLSCISGRCSKGSLVNSILMTIEMYCRQMFNNPLKLIDGFVFVSGFCRDVHILHDSGFSKAESMVLYNSTVRQEGIDSRRGEYFLYYGRLSYEKGVEDVIKAFSRDDAAAIKIVGTGPMEGILKQLASGHANIEFVGYKSGMELFELLAGCSYVIVPSRWYENNPMTIVEAYAYGKPVIGAEIGGITEILKGTGCGWTYPSGDIDALAASVSEAASLPDSKYDEMCSFARAFYDGHFSEQGHYEKLVSFYDAIIANHGR